MHARTSEASVQPPGLSPGMQGPDRGRALRSNSSAPLFPAGLPAIAEPAGRRLRDFHYDPWLHARAATKSRPGPDAARIELN
jgi:hypothetical protein